MNRVQKQGTERVRSKTGYVTIIATLMHYLSQQATSPVTSQAHIAG